MRVEIKGPIIKFVKFSMKYLNNNWSRGKVYIIYGTYCLRITLYSHGASSMLSHGASSMLSILLIMCRV